MKRYKWRETRIKLGLTQQHLADTFKVSLKTYIRWENLEHTPKKCSIEYISKVLEEKLASRML